MALILPLAVSAGTSLPGLGREEFRVLINLLSNAIKYSPPGGEVRLKAERGETGMARLSIEDQGPGIPEGYHQRIFERFGQVEAATHRDKGGTGLGLAICKAIVEHHGGHIGVDSQPGKGSTFWVDLPLAPGQPFASAFCR